MTPEQFERWKDFALRMARTAFKGRRRPGPRHVVACVTEFFGDFETGAYGLDLDMLPAIIDFDHSGEYPEGHQWRERESRSSYCDCQGRREFDGRALPDCPDCRGIGHFRHWNTAPYVCDVLSSYDEAWVPNYWGDLEGDAWERHQDRWAGPAVACIRAGLDAAVGRSGGVLGFTAGDLRRMYPEGVPEWVMPANERLYIEQYAECAIGLIPKGEPVLNGTFAELPDEAGIWL